MYICKLRRERAAADEKEIALLRQLACGRRAPALYRSSLVPTPMLVGLLRPTIYLPDAMYSEAQLRNILLHELTHFRRGDIIIKRVATFAVHIHCINPFVYLIHREINRTCELACDEAVVKYLNDDEKQAYGDTLIAVAARENLKIVVLATTMCEEKKILKERLGAIMRSRKLTGGVITLSCALFMVVLCGAVVLAASGAQRDRTFLMGANYWADEILYNSEEGREPCFEYWGTVDFHLYTLASEHEEPEYVGVSEPYSLTKKELEKYTLRESAWMGDYNIREITDAVIFRMEGDYFYLLFQTIRGDTLLGYGWEDVSERGQGASDDTALFYLYSLKSKVADHSIYTNYFDHSLSHIVNANAYTFHYFESDDIPGYLIVGFMSGEAEHIFEMTDLGFAVFQSAGGEGYRLLDWHVYKDAAVSGNGIYFAEHPALADINGNSTNENSYDVILSCNENLASVVKLLDGQYELTERVDSRLSMTLFRWDDSRNALQTEVHFYDKGGNEIFAP